MSENRFTAKFGDFALLGDTITCEINGFTITARVERDDDMGPPWKEHGGHGPVSDWTDRPQRPGELVISSDRSRYRYYDFKEAIKIAKRDGWDVPPYAWVTPGEQAERAVRHDYNHLRAWCNDEWYWCGIVLSVQRAGIMLDSHAASIWGTECNAGDNSHLTELANELLDQAIEKGTKIMNEILADWLLTEKESNV